MIDQTRIDTFVVGEKFYVSVIKPVNPTCYGRIGG